MTIYSVFGTSVAASALMGQLLWPVVQRSEPQAPAPSAVSRVAVGDEAANIVFDRAGHKIGRSFAIRHSETGELLAITDQGEKPVAMMRGPDGMLRLVAQ